jgi:hypothetical protein
MKSKLLLNKSNIGNKQRSVSFRAFTGLPFEKQVKILWVFEAETGTDLLYSPVGVFKQRQGFGNFFLSY